MNNLTEGPELDELIAIEVLGLPKQELTHDGPCPDCRCKVHLGSNRAWCSQCSEWKYSSYREYSSDLNRAWEVVRNLEEKNIFLELAPAMGVIQGRMYQVSFIRYLPDEEFVPWQETPGFTEQKELPLAICIAALKAVTGRTL